MYTPEKFNIEDREAILRFIRQNPFGLLLSVGGGVIHDTHTPFIVAEDGKQLLGHLARANPQWASWGEGSVAKVVFSGPHAYVSPRYYESEFAVPTWNYTAVSVSGQISVHDDRDEKLDFLDQLTAANESSDSPWILPRSDERYLKLLAGIVVFSVSIDSLEASFKLNQNKSAADQRKVIASLNQTGCPFDGEVASMMVKNLGEAETGVADQPAAGSGAEAEKE